MHSFSILVISSLNNYHSNSFLLILCNQFRKKKETKFGLRKKHSSEKTSLGKNIPRKKHLSGKTSLFRATPSFYLNCSTIFSISFRISLIVSCNSKNRLLKSTKSLINLKFVTFSLLILIL